MISYDPEIAPTDYSSLVEFFQLVSLEFDEGTEHDGEGCGARTNRNRDTS